MNTSPSVFQAFLNVILGNSYPLKHIVRGSCKKSILSCQKNSKSLYQVAFLANIIIKEGIVKDDAKVQVITH